MFYWEQFHFLGCPCYLSMGLCNGSLCSNEKYLPVGLLVVKPRKLAFQTVLAEAQFQQPTMTPPTPPPPPAVAANCIGVDLNRIIMSRLALPIRFG